MATKAKSTAATLGVVAPKSTYEKNICLFLKRNNNTASIKDIAEKMDEREIIITQLVENMRKGKLVNVDDGIVYLNIIIAG